MRNQRVIRFLRSKITAHITKRKRWAGGRKKKRRAGKTNTSGLFFVCGGNSARRSGAWPAASITSGMPAGCKQPAQKAFLGGFVMRAQFFSFFRPEEKCTGRAA